MGALKKMLLLALKIITEINGLLLLVLN